MANISQDLSQDIVEIVFTREQIAARVRELGAQIARDYAGQDLVLIGILRGGLVFLSDLSREIPIAHAFDMVGASSYGNATSSSGRVQITKDVEVNLRGKEVVICEDIYDSGRTLSAIKDLLRVHHPKGIEVCALLYKNVKKRAAEVYIKYTGFEIADKFVVGYGLDFQEIYRNLPYIGVLSPSVYAEPPSLPKEA